MSKVQETAQAAAKPLQKAMESANALFSEYNERYVKKAVETGRVLAVDARRNTLEALEGVMGDSKKILKSIPKVEAFAPKLAQMEAPENYFVVATFQKATDSAAAAVKEYNEVLKKSMDSGRQWVEAMTQKTREKGTGVFETSRITISTAAKKAADEAKTLAQTMTVKISAQTRQVSDFISTKVDQGLKTVTNALDLPTRQDITKLTRAMNALSKKMDAMSQ
jgi:valyl-tRNA synthetase